MLGTGSFTDYFQRIGVSVLQTKLEDYVSGGFFVVPLASRRPWMPAELLPERLMSVSATIGGPVPDVWAYQWWYDDESARRWEAAEGSIPFDAEHVHDVVDWVTSRFEQDIGWINVFLSLDAAHEFRQRYIPPAFGAQILGIGLHHSAVEHFLTHEQPTGDQQPSGIYHMLEMDRRMSRQGQAVGFDVLGLDAYTFYSWIDVWADFEVYKRLGIRPNHVGLLERQSDVSAVVEYARQAPRENVGLWLPWLILQHT